MMKQVRSSNKQYKKFVASWGSCPVPAEFLVSCNVEHEASWNQKCCHSFAQKHQFRGPWDAAWKVVKSAFRKWELEDMRAAISCDCHTSHCGLYQPQAVVLGQGWKSDKYPDLVKNTPWKVTKRYFGCVIDDRSEFDRLVANPMGYKHVVFTGRENVQPMPAIHGSSLFHEVSTTGKTKMESTTRWVRPREASDEAPTRKSILEELEGSASAIVGAEMVTVKTLAII
jgi:hypothetical protein